MIRHNPFEWVATELNKLKKTGLYNEIKIISSPNDARIKIGKKEYVNLCSNNYLGLANNPRLKIAVVEAVKKYGVGPGAVRTIAGTTKLHDILEKKLAKFKKVEKVITLQSGFTANLAVIPALTGEGDFIFSDELNHASIIDGCRLSKATVVRYKHNDAADLDKKIKETKNSGRSLIITDGVFSMDGDIADLPALVKVAQKYGFPVMVDDAHGEGVLGKNGRGIVDHFNLHGQVDIEVGTLSKAFGVIGGFVAGSKEIIEWLTQRGRPFLFSSAMTIPDIAASIEALNILETSDELIRNLWKNTHFMKDNLKILGFDIGNSKTPIIPIMLGDAKLAREFSQKLFKHSIFAKAICYPTVPEGKARIRIMNTAAHGDRDLKEALEAFAHVGKALRVI